MAVLNRRLSERLTGVAYQLGWKVICRIPESWARWAFMKVAGVAWRRQGPGVQVLEANLRRVLSWKYGTDEVDGKELRTLSRAALRSYARYWLEAFRLPVIPAERLVSGMRFQGPNEAALFDCLKAGRGVIIALPHMGNFDQAGVWVIARGAGKFTTVAERLRPESVYESFLRFREGLGFEVLPPPVSGRTSIPRPSRNRTNASYTDSGLSRSTTVVNEPAPTATTQAPACSKLPMCGSAMITPRPAFRFANRASFPAASMCIPDTSRSTGITGSRNVSSQYRA